MSGSILVSWMSHGTALPTLVCLPPAGAGAGQFQEWQQRLGPSVGVLGVQLPGREERWDEPPMTTVAALVDEVATALGDRPSDVPLAVLGLSFGGLLAYEITRRLGQIKQWPTALVVAACRPPPLWLDGPGLVTDVRVLNQLLADRGLSPDDLDPDSRKLLFDLLRDDIRLSLTFRHRALGTVRCPVWALGGDRDRVVTADQLAGWEPYAAGPFTRTIFKGGHYFWTDHLDTILDRLRQLLRVGAGKQGLGNTWT